jgi:hypothetical protein
MLDVLAEIIAVVGSAILAVVGASAIESPWKKYVAVLGAATVAASAWAAFVGIEDRSFVRGQLTGGDSYCYLFAKQISQSPPLFQLWIVNQGDYPISDIEFAVSPLDAPTYGMPGYAKYKGGRFESLAPNERRATSVGVPADDLHIDIHTKSGTYSQTLIVKNVAGRDPNRMMEVEKDGKIIVPPYQGLRK